MQEKLDLPNYDVDDDEGEDEFAQATSSTDKIIEKAYTDGRLRVVQERNDFFLPHVVDFISGRQWGNLSPEYQRRLRWSQEKKSKLIESFLMNVPVPPVFLFDGAGMKLEVLDGQQRINAIKEFLGGSFDLERLKIWPSLNGRSFSKLPPALKRGLNRAKLSAITLIADSTAGDKNQIDLRAQVFERLNTGGEKLNPQELRNCLYSGSFNKLITELSGIEKFTKCWGIPARAEHTLSDGSYDDVLKANKLFSTMADCQIVLRYFAFRDEANVRGSTRSILDNCMKRLRRATDDEVTTMKNDFIQALDVAVEIFGAGAFRVGAGENGRLSRPLFDAEMIALSRLMKQRVTLIDKREEIKAKIAGLTAEGTATYDMIVGRPNTADAIKKRIDAVQSVIEAAIA